MTNLTLRTIALIIGRVTGITLNEMRSLRRPQTITNARMLYYWAARTYTAKTLPEIGDWLGRDHTTVLHGIRSVDAKVAAGAPPRHMPEVVDAIAQAEARLAAGQSALEDLPKPTVRAEPSVALVTMTLEKEIAELRAAAEAAAAAWEAYEQARYSPAERRALELVKQPMLRLREALGPILVARPIPTFKRTSNSPHKETLNGHA